MDSMEEMGIEMHEGSPADRVEQLLRKYKSKQVSKSTEKLQSLSKELEAWNLVNDELHLHGYQPVRFASHSTTTFDRDCLFLKESSSCALRQTLLRLIEEVRRKEGIIQDLLTTLKSSRIYQTKSRDGSIGEVDLGHMTSTTTGHVTTTADDLVQKLQAQVAELEYGNAKLKFDLQNRSELQDVRRCQKRLRDVERELQRCKTLLSSEQVDLLQSQQHMKHVCAVLHVRSGDEIVPCITDMMRTIESRQQLDKHLMAVLDTVYHPKAPSVLVEDSPLKLSSHDMWCEFTWRHVALTLQEWLRHLIGLQELESTFGEVCKRLQLVAGSDENSEGESGDDDQLQPKELSLTSGDMAGLLRHWLVKKTNMKAASAQALLAMVRHFQQLFDVKNLESVYTQMNGVYQQLEEARYVIRHLKAALHLELTCTSRKLVSAVEFLSEGTDAQLLLHIHNELGVQDVNTVLEKLRLCEEFFPTFQVIITEIQQFLGVDSLSEIIPALHDMQRPLH